MLKEALNCKRQGYITLRLPLSPTRRQHTFVRWRPLTFLEEHRVVQVGMIKEALNCKLQNVKVTSHCHSPPPPRYDKQASGTPSTGLLAGDRSPSWKEEHRVVQVGVIKEAPNCKLQNVKVTSHCPPPPPRYDKQASGTPSLAGDRSPSWKESTGW